jgi:hypothetical protein
MKALSGKTKENYLCGLLIFTTGRGCGGKVFEHDEEGERYAALF